MNNELLTQLTPPLLEAKRKLSQLQDAVRQHGQVKPEAAPKSRINPAIFKALAAAKKTWEAIPANQAKLQAMKQMPLPELVQALRGITTDPIFAPAFALGKSSNSEALTGDFSNVLGCFSVGLAGQIDLGVGVTGTIGYAFNPNDDTQFSVFISVGVVGGPDAEADVGVELGAWSSTPGDMSGAMIGGGVGLDPEGFGASVAAFVGCGVKLLPPFITLDFSSYGGTLTLSIGEGGGALGVLCYTQVLVTEDIPPIAQPNASNMIRVTCIECVQKKDWMGDNDELVMQFQMDGKGPIYPFPTWSHYSIAEGGKWWCERSIKLNDYVVVTLAGICTWTIYANDVQASYHYDSGGLNSTIYNLYVEKISNYVQPVS